MEARVQDVAEMGTELVIASWGTWEELLLGGAVLRHGTRDWDVVAAELRARTVGPYNFTPEVCKAKYQDLQQRYSGCTAWFEELRKQRMAELRRALELSEDSIGSLETKLETLKAEKVDYCQVDYDAIQIESPVQCQKSEPVESSSKETSKDLLSAGSYTCETQTNWLPECHIPVAVSTEETESKLEGSLSTEQEKVSGIGKLLGTTCEGKGSGVRKRRGKRKRKDCSKDVKEGSVGESDFWGSANVATAFRCIENSASNSGPIDKTCTVVDQSRDSSKCGIDDLMEIFESVAENKCASVFRHRLDSQKRGRYKKMILRHMDVDTIRSRIAGHIVTTAKELFRDLLLVANNALVFYSKNTREYKSAILLRHVVTKALQQHFKNHNRKATTHTSLSYTSPMLNPPVKPRSARPNNQKLSGKLANTGNGVRTPGGSKRSSNADSSPLPPVMTKKSFGRPRKVGCGNASQGSETARKGRKRTRSR